MLSQKQISSIKESSRRINIWEGSVRSGKSFSALLRFIKALPEEPHGQAMIIGPSRDSIQRNVITQLCDWIPMRPPTPKSTQLTLYNRAVHLVGASDERAQRRIQGSTLALAYVDELSLLPEGFFRMLLSRLSVTGAMLFATTNPDSPYHWLKRDFLDRSEELDLINFPFRIEDNPSLSKEYINNLKKEYSGMWYERYIEGKWVLADGLVYSHFDPQEHVIPDVPGQADYYVVGVDYGTTNPTAFVMVGYSGSTWPRTWVEKEYYWDSSKEQFHKTDTDYAEDLTAFVSGYNVKAIYIDPSALSFRTELKRHLTSSREANNDVLSGIRYVSQQLANGAFKVCSNCVHIQREFGAYVWDSKASERGEDKPRKSHDHCFDGSTLIATQQGQKPIDHVTEGELVLTRRGYREVKKVFVHEDEVFEWHIIGKRVKCTENHPFYTWKGWKPCGELMLSDVLFTQVEGKQWKKSSNGKGLSTDAIHMLKTSLTSAISELTKQIVLKEEDISIEIFGDPPMDPSQRDIIFITRTGTHPTIALAISSAFQQETILADMPSTFRKNVCNLLEIIWKKLGHSPKNGTVAQKEGDGIQRTQKEPTLLSFSLPPASSAVQSTKLQSAPTSDFVQISVGLPGGDPLVLTMRRDAVKDAINFLSLTNIQRKDSAESPVPRRRIGKQKVYNLHVEGENEFFAEGFLVHNCLDALRYALFSHWGHKTKNSLSAEELEKLYYETMHGPQLPAPFQQPGFFI